MSRLFRKAPPEPRWIEVAALRDALAGAVPPLVLDVRGTDEFDGPLGHIAGARNMPLPELATHHGEIAGAARPVICVCLTDKRSSAAAAQLAAAGIDGVSVLRGGMKAWREAGL
ncbi:MAG TPA: rhodanese-like domain-containing protein [Stellaceae bacterium]|nr:rhodanese-like domain-containing protein [Stellaceae bacterium]